MEHVFPILLGLILATMLGLFIISQLLAISHRKRVFDFADRFYEKSVNVVLKFIYGKDMG